MTLTGSPLILIVSELSRSDHLSLWDELIKKKPRETSGSSSSNRFSFQIDWAFLKLIELHKAKKEYLIVLDIHEDVGIANSESDPTEIDFFQVKSSRDREWSEARLLYRTKRTSLSILGKLFANRLTFPDHSRTLAFVSNARCVLPFDPAVKDHPAIFFGKLSQPCKNKILKQLRKEHKLDVDPNCDDCLQFVLTDLSVDKHWRDVQGELSEFCKSISPDGTYPVAALYLTIGDRLRRRSDQEKIPGTVDELIKKKAIGSSEVQELFDKMTPVARLSTLWITAKPDLTNAGIGIFEVKAIQAGWNRYGVNRRDPTNKAVKRLRGRILKGLRAVESRGGNVTVLDLLSAVIAEIGNVPKVFQGDYLKGAILLEFHDDQYEQLPAATAESEGEAA